MTLHAAAAPARAADRVPPAAADLFCCVRPRSAANQPHTPLLLSIDGTDRQTDGRTIDCYIDSAPHTMRVALIDKTGGPKREPPSPIEPSSNDTSFHEIDLDLVVHGKSSSSLSSSFCYTLKL